MSTAPVAPATASFFNRKFLNVPYLYWAAGFVAVLALLAWRMKPSAAAEVEEDEGADDSGYDSGGALAEQYPDMPTGTVIVAPNPPEQDNSLDNQSITDNETWLKRGVAFLVGRGTGAGEAQAALQTYLEGKDMSYSQGKLRDTVIAELGMPPVAPAIGKTNADVARQQGPLPRVHIVRGANDNSVAKIARLYYGRSDEFAIKNITSSSHFKKTNQGRVSNFPVGAKVHVPALPSPKVTAPTITNKKPVKPKTPAVKRVTVRRGSKAPNTIKYLQKRLGVNQDGIFGPKTEAAVKAFQRKHGLKVDGVVGPATWAKIG